MGDFPALHMRQNRLGKHFCWFHDTCAFTHPPRHHNYWIHSHYCRQTCVQEKYPAACCQVWATFDACNSYKPSASAGKYWCFSSFETTVMQCMITEWHKASGNAEAILTQTGTTWWHLSPSNKHLWGTVSWISHYLGDHTLTKSYGCICLDVPSPRVSKHILSLVSLSAIWKPAPVLSNLQTNLTCWGWPRWFNHTLHLSYIKTRMH